MRIKRSNWFLFVSMLLLMGRPTMAEEHEHREHGAHEHGAAQLTIAMDGEVLEMMLSAPAMNIIGFEHVPHNETQHYALERAVEQLQQWQQLFELPEAAECRLDTMDVDSALLEAEGHSHEGHNHRDDVHSEFEVSYRFRCQSPEDVTSIKMQLFDVFPGNEYIEVQYIMPSGQGMQVLDAAHNRLSF